MAPLLLLSVFVISTCGLVYELVTGALASYLLGDSITQFSTVIGVYLFSMGIGSWLSRYVRRNAAAVFVQVEILVGLVGGFSAAALFLLFEHVASFRVALYGLVTLTGVLVGLEIPLLMRILKDRYEFKDLVSRVFTFDYVGALIASLLFPLVLVPHLGLMRTCFLFGMLNVAVALATLYLFRQHVAWSRPLKATGAAVLVALLLGFIYSERLMSYAETQIYPGQVIYSRSTPYQRIVLTRATDDIRLFLSAHLQFSSKDEYRYHESLIHPGLDSLAAPRKVLVLGGGDGLAVREILKHPAVESVTLVDLDPEMTRLFSVNEALAELNGHAFSNPKVRVINDDAFVWLRERKPESERFDFIVLDFPDPANFSIGKLYTTAFFKLLRGALAADGMVVIQSTSPLAARKSYWCIARTLAAAGFETTPYHVYVPSFGEWGFVLGTLGRRYEPPRTYVPGLRFVNAETTAAMLQFPPDMQPVPAEVNQLNNQILVRYYESEWSEYLQ